MSETAPEFGASDLGGPKHVPPSRSTTPDADLTNELIKRKAWSRKFALGALIAMSLSALGCLGFAMYVGCHFLGALEKHEEFNRKQAPVVTEVAPSASKPQKTLPPSSKTANKSEPATEKPNNEKLFFTTLAPLIPASFSSAIAIILFITIARFVTNFERIGKEGSEKETEDYGAIAALVQEVGKLIQTLRGK